MLVPGPIFELEGMNTLIGQAALTSEPGARRGWACQTSQPEGRGSGPPAEWGRGAALSIWGIPPPRCLPARPVSFSRHQTDSTVMFMPLRTQKKKCLRWLRFLKHVCTERVWHFEP